MFALKASCVFGLAAGTVTEIYNQPPSTLKGCECTSGCETSGFFECYAAPFCKVKSKHCANGTAEWSLSRFSHFDYCTFESYKTYEDLKAEAKKKMVLAHVNEDKVSGQYPPALSLFTGIMSESVMVSFDASADVFPQHREKYIHSVGVTGGIKFESVGNHPYTGLFKGAEHGVIRLSSAKEPAKGAGVAPGMGIKFFRDGRPSANFVAMYSLDGQPTTETNFFEHEWNNHINLTDNFALKLVAQKFWQASYCPLMVGLSDLTTDENGKPGVFPFRLNFRSSVKSECHDDDYAGCLKTLEKIPVGSELFEVRAQAAPGAKEMLIGKITITDALTTSKFGDDQLFFRHQHMEEDYELKPEWLASIDRKTQCGMGNTGTKAPPISKGCSSPFINNKISSTKGMRQDDHVVV